MLEELPQVPELFALACSAAMVGSFATWSISRACAMLGSIVAREKVTVAPAASVAAARVRAFAASSSPARNIRSWSVIVSSPRAVGAERAQVRVGDAARRERPAPSAASGSGDVLAER